MSNTPVDMAKVSQLLDNGWVVCLSRNQLGSYTASAQSKRLLDDWQWGDIEDFPEPEDNHITDDFTPEQALTRLAYKVQGEILDSTAER